MNIIVLMLDSLRQDHVSYYGWEGCPLETPNIDAVAAEAVVFDNVYPEDLPTIPVRTDLMTGQSGLTNRSWQPLVPTDVTAAQILSKEGYLTAIVADTYHLFKPNMNFHNAFDAFHWIRGAEYDSVSRGPMKHLKLEDHITDRMPRYWLESVRKVLRNLDGRVAPEDFPCWQTVDKALEVLRHAREDKRQLFLWLDTFQPHEPWCPPAKFDTFGDPDYAGPKVVMPPGGLASTWGDDNVSARIKSLYAGEAAYTDHCMGRLLDGMREMGYFDDSLIVILSDHGHPLADHGKFLKGGDRLYSELLKVPFVMRLPGGEHGGRRVQTLGRFPDLLPTMLDLAGLGAAGMCMAGRSLKPVIEGQDVTLYPATVSGFFETAMRCIRTQQHSLFLGAEGDTDELYDLQADPRERTNIIAEAGDVAAEMVKLISPIYLGQRRTARGVQGTMEVAHTSLE
jgi:arylsulfatase A-like enzyme